MRRRGYSLIELIVALIAATALVSSLAATVVITTSLLEIPPDSATVWHDRAIADRVAADLRYATAIDESPPYGFQLSRPDPASGQPRAISYEAYLGGLTRRVDNGPAITYDPQVPSHVFQVDGYTAPTQSATAPHFARLHATSHARSSDAVPGIDIDIPPGCKTGDLLMLCVSAKTPTAVDVSGSSWQTLRVQSIDGLRLVTVYRLFDTSMASTITINVAPASAIAAAMLAIENVDLAYPIVWTGTASGHALSWDPPSHPVPVESAVYGSGELNIQIFAADGSPWTPGSLGLASFTDAVQTTSAAGSLLENSLGIAIRSGPVATMSTVPRLWHQRSGNYLQFAVKVGVKP
jgi:hypothetical protein